MKKVISLLLMLTLMFAIAACGNNEQTEPTEAQQPQSTQPAVDTEGDWIDDSFDELNFKVKSNWTKDTGSGTDYETDVEYYINEDGTEIHIASIPRLLDLYNSPEELIKNSHQDDLREQDNDEKVEILKEEAWENGNVSGYQGVTRESDDDGDVKQESTVAIFTEKTCYFINFNVENNETGITEEEFQKFLKTITI